MGGGSGCERCKDSALHVNEGRVEVSSSRQSTERGLSGAQAGHCKGCRDRREKRRCTSQRGRGHKHPLGATRHENCPVSATTGPVAPQLYHEPDRWLNPSHSVKLTRPSLPSARPLPAAPSPPGSRFQTPPAPRLRTALPS